MISSFSRTPSIASALWLSASLTPLYAQPAQLESETVESWIERLDDPSFEARSKATTELCRIGPKALPALRTAAGGAGERAYRAQHLVNVLEQIYFAGLEVSLSGPARVESWSTPFDVEIRFRNSSSYASKLPFELPESSLTNGPSLAEQVGAMVDLADCLMVLDPKGEPIPLHVDDIREDQGVSQAIDARLTTFPESTVPTDETRSITLAQFNRGWARYPMLQAGTYSIQFRYVPQWDVEELAAEEVGKVSSKSFSLTIESGAPVEIVGPQRRVQLSVEIGPKQATATLLNQGDTPLWINENLGQTAPPFAALIWYVWNGADWEKFLEPEIHDIRKAEFVRERLVALDPGTKLTVGEISSDRVAELARMQGAKIDGRVRLRVEYSNRTDVLWQRDQHPTLIGSSEAPAPLRSPLPLRMYVGRVISDEVVLSIADSAN